MKTIHLSVNEFLSREKPWEYLVETFGDKPDWIVPESELIALRDEMPLMSDNYLACALPIAEYSQPHLFADLAARLLSHPSMSVRVNAYRVLRAIHRDYLDDSLRNTVAYYLKQCPEAEHFTDVLVRL